MVASLIDRLHRFGDGEGQEVRENKRSNPEPGKKGPPTIQLRARLVLVAVQAAEGGFRVHFVREGR